MLRPNLAMDPPPTEIAVGGVWYPANTDYRVWLQVLEVMRKWRSDPKAAAQNMEVAAELQQLVFSGVLADEPVDAVLNAIVAFSQGYPSAPTGGAAAETPVFSFAWDLNEIIIAIRNQSGRDISHRCTHFHWWEFLLEFRTLCGDHSILRLMEIRGYKGNDPDMLRRKRQCALPVEHTAEEQAALDEINELFSGAV